MAIKFYFSALNQLENLAEGMIQPMNLFLNVIFNLSFLNFIIAIREGVNYFVLNEHADSASFILFVLPKACLLLNILLYLYSVLKRI